MYVLMLGELDEQDYSIRSFSNKDAVPERVEILGDWWDSKMVCSEINVVTRVFREFFDTHNVSVATLD